MNKEVAMVELDSELLENVRLLGELLVQNIKEHLGQEFLDSVEAICATAKFDREESSGDANLELVALLEPLISF
jgi:phosphoenolpyruvate carboxylase